MKATFAGGCFWCMVPPFENLDVEIVTGYSGGEEENPKYEDIKNTSHVEAIQITYDPDQVSYEQLLEIFWRQIDPTDEGGQFADRGHHYRTAIFYHNERQKELAEKSKEKISEEFDKPIVTTIEKYRNFYPAEEEHQNYHRKNPMRYKLYKKFSGRKAFLEDRWG